MDFIKKLFMIIHVVFGLIIITAIAYAYLTITYFTPNAQDRKNNAQLMVAEQAQELQKNGLADQKLLLDQYKTKCLSLIVWVGEGNKNEVCDKTAAVLMSESKKLNLSVSNISEIAVNTCIEQVEKYGEKVDFCYKEQTKYETELFIDAIAFTACEYSRLWLTVEDRYNTITKRGNEVYLNFHHKLFCDDPKINKPDYDLFFTSKTYPDDQINSENRQLPNALINEEIPLVDFLAGYQFGDVPKADLALLLYIMHIAPSAHFNTILAKGNVPLNFNTGYYEQPLARAIEREKIDKAMLLLGAGADPLIPTKYGLSLISKAAYLGDLNLIKKLIEKGADVDGIKGAEDRDFASPLKGAAWAGHQNIVDYLIANGAKITPTDKRLFPQWELESFLHNAAQGGNFSIFKRFINFGGEFERENDKKGKLIIHAIEGENPDILQAVFALGYQLPAEKKYHDRIYDKVTDIIGKNYQSNKQAGLDMFEILIEQGLFMGKADKSGWHYGHKAIRSYSPNYILLPYDKTHEEMAAKAITAKVLVTFAKRVVEEVLKSGIDINAKADEGRTMLMLAADKGQDTIVEYLLNQGADQTLTDDNGDTALDYATKRIKRLIDFWKKSTVISSHHKNTVNLLGGDISYLTQE